MNAPIPFEVEVLNIGNAMDLTSGIFTAPRTGIYSFSFTGFVHIPASSHRLYIYVEMHLNGNVTGKGHAAHEGSAYDQWPSYSFQSTLDLQKADKIWLQISGIAGTSLYDSSSHLNHFSGWLLEENISDSMC